MHNSRPVSVQHYENFPVASWLCPPRLRPPITAIYWFARTADDLADEGDASATERFQRLRAFRSAWRDVAAGAAPDATPWPGVLAPLQRALTHHALPLDLLEDLLDAFEQDIPNPIHPDRASLLHYCQRSANPVGRLLLHLYAVHDAHALRRSDQICTALQLINFWQDLSVDLPRGRCYLPIADARRHGVDPLQRLGAPPSPASAHERALVAELCAWARALMLEGAPLARQLPGRAGWELRLVVQGGLRILEKIQTMDHDSFARRPTLARRDALPLLWRALWRTPRLSA